MAFMKLGRHAGAQDAGARALPDEPAQRGFRQSMAWLHTWAGLVMGWVLFLVFLTGTLAYVQQQITHWMQPERAVLLQQPDMDAMVSQSLDWLADNAADATQWSILPPNWRYHHLWVSWRTPGGTAAPQDHYHQLDWSGGSGQADVRDTRGGAHFLDLHYRLHYMPRVWGMRIVGALTMLLLVTILSGVVTHRKIFADFFTFRPRKGQRSWLDAHTLLGVAALPYHLVIAYSGLVFLMFVYMPVPPQVVYGNDSADFFAEIAMIGGTTPTLPAARAAAMMPLGPLIERAQRETGDQAEQLIIRNPGRENADVHVLLTSPDRLTAKPSLVSFNGMTGEPLVVDEMRTALLPAMSNGVTDLRDVLIKLHLAQFAAPWLRLLFVLCGLGGALLVATGLVLWSKRRSERLRASAARSSGQQWVERLNIGTLVGLPVAIAAYFWANRLLPLQQEILGIQRQDLEIHLMFAVWLALLLWPMWRAAQRAWVDLLALAAMAFGLIPALNAVTTDQHLLNSIPAGDWVMAGFDLLAFAVGLIFAWMTWRLHRKPHRMATAGPRIRRVARAAVGD